MLLIDGWNTAMSAEYDMINEMGITHNGTKVSIIPRLHNPWPSTGSPPATGSHDALPAVPPLPLATLRFAVGTAVTQWSPFG